jgi:hypothetical protein
VLLALLADHLLIERRDRWPIRAFSATPHDGQRRRRTLAEDPGRTRPELRMPGAAAQTRMVSVAEFRADPGNPRDLSKG